MAIGVPAICYIVVSPFIYQMAKCMPKRGVICVGFFNISIAMLMIGGSSFFSEKNGAVFTLSGLVLMGVSSGMISILALPEMLEVFESDSDLVSKYDREAAENMISGLFVTAQACGETFGPIVSAQMNLAVGF